MGLSFPKPAAIRRDFVGTEVLYYDGVARNIRKFVSIFPSVFYVLFQSYIDNVEVFACFLASQSVRPYLFAKGP